MPFFLLYILKFSIALGIIYLFYRFVLIRLTFYNWNRWYLLGYSLSAFIIAFVDVSPVLKNTNPSQNQILDLIPAIENFTENGLQFGQGEVSVFNYWYLFAVIFFAGILFFFIRLVIQFLSLRRIRLDAESYSETGIKVYRVKGNVIPFSFGNSIFLNPALHSEEELKNIVSHEFVHVRQKHTIDILWSEFLCIFNWYNPFAWLIRKAIRQNLEFIADNNVVKGGLEKKQYQYLLLKVIGNNQFSIASQFNFSSLKKRIAMMNKMKSARVHLIKFLFMLPLVAVMLLAFRKEQTEKKDPDLYVLSYVEDSIPPPPKPPVPGNVQKIEINDANKAVVQLKDGKTEKYNLNNSSEKEAFEKKYGRVPVPPLDARPSLPAAPARPIRPKMPENVKRISVDDNNKAEVMLKNGKTEKYDLNNSAEKEEFEKKYGKLPSPPPPPAVSDEVAQEISAVNFVQPVSANVVTTSNINPSINTSNNVSVTSNAVVAKNVTATNVYNTVSDIVSVSNEPVVVNTTVSGLSQNVRTDVAINSEGKVLLKITRNTTQSELNELKEKMDQAGYILKIENVNFNDGFLEQIRGSIKSKTDHNLKANFNANEFSKIIVMVKEAGGSSGINVHITGRKAKL